MNEERNNNGERRLGSIRLVNRSSLPLRLTASDHPYKVKIKGDIQRHYSNFEVARDSANYILASHDYELQDVIIYHTDSGLHYRRDYNREWRIIPDPKVLSSVLESI